MIPFSLLLLSLSSLSFGQSEDQYAPTPGPTVYFRPSVAIVIGIFAMMFSLTFLLLMYAKYCHNNSPGLSANDADVFLSPDRAHSPPTGIAKAVIESLPFFRFSALRGSRAGMECAVCLSPYTDAELLRLLPACKHAFHMSCVDQWLERHSSCPLCRAPVLEYSADQAGDDVITPDVLSLFVEREPSFRFEEKKKEVVHKKKGAEKPPPVAPVYDKFKHRIVISGAVLKSRWSDLNSADLMSLNCDMFRVDSSRRFSMPDLVAKPEKNIPVVSIKEEMEKKRLLELRANQLSSSCKDRSVTAEPTAVISRATRSMSEIVNFARVRGSRDPNPVGADDQVRRMWLPIARRTVRWFAGREGRSHMLPQPYTREEVITASNPDYKTEIDLVTSV
ncbi:E3 ubiquitin-protein ligase ATL42-like protein [Carex littledalei]|uniref:RING-type E3 ubiquitin transferase n=1 Tax=Carex littledalei TaxID=544730 RepID=A0A833RPU2_9POAL|nr:E3 ubiquitin-protein ligase ATL42-like protein [Carex littledalei]